MKTFLDGFVDLIPDPTVVVDREGHILASNAQTQELLKWSEAELLGKPIRVLIPKRYHGNHDNFLAGFMRSASTRSMNEGGGLYVLAKAGQEIPVSISLHPLEHDGELVVVAAIRDVSLQVKAEQEVRENAQRLRNLIDSAPIGAFLLELMDDDEFMVIGSNRAADRILGVDATSYTERTLENAFPGIYHSPAREIYKKVAKTGETLHIESLPYSDDKVTGIYEVTAAQIGPGQVSVFFADISEDLRDFEATLQGWSRALDLRDNETAGHTTRVSELAVAIGKAMDLDEAQQIYLRWGALLHDIGKMGIPDQILLKPGALTKEEWEIMKMHPVYAYEMLEPITFVRPAIDVPYAHHEKWDGSGYPLGLKGKQIPKAARIFCVADVWDALRSNRPYRDAWSSEEALDYIKEQSGTHFQPEVVDVFLEVHKDSLRG